MTIWLGELPRETSTQRSGKFGGHCRAGCSKVTRSPSGELGIAASQPRYAIWIDRHQTPNQNGRVFVALIAGRVGEAKSTTDKVFRVHGGKPFLNDRSSASSRWGKQMHSLMGKLVGGEALIQEGVSRKLYDDVLSVAGVPDLRMVVTKFHTKNGVVMIARAKATLKVSQHASES